MPSPGEVSEATSSGWATTSGSSVVNTRVSPMPPDVVTWVPVGTATSCATGPTNQNVRSARAAVAGKGSNPIRFSMCV